MSDKIGPKIEVEFPDLGAKWAAKECSEAFHMIAAHDYEIESNRPIGRAPIPNATSDRLKAKAVEHIDAAIAYLTATREILTSEGGES